VRYEVNAVIFEYVYVFFYSVCQTNKLSSQCYCAAELARPARPGLAARGASGAMLLPRAARRAQFSSQFSESLPGALPTALPSPKCFLNSFPKNGPRQKALGFRRPPRREPILKFKVRGEIILNSDGPLYPRPWALGLRQHRA
jgi:hypothetical protein